MISQQLGSLMRPPLAALILRAGRGAEAIECARRAHQLDRRNLWTSIQGDCNRAARRCVARLARDGSDLASFSTRT